MRSRGGPGPRARRRECRQVRRRASRADRARPGVALPPPASRWRAASEDRTHDPGAALHRRAPYTTVARYARWLEGRSRGSGGGARLLRARLQGVLATIRLAAAAAGQRWQRQLADLTDDAAELPVQRAGVVRDAVALGDLADLGRYLGVAVGGKVGEQVVLDLEAEVAREDGKQLAAGEVGRAG